VSYLSVAFFRRANANKMKPSVVFVLGLGYDRPLQILRWVVLGWTYDNDVMDCVAWWKWTYAQLCIDAL